MLDGLAAHSDFLLEVSYARSATRTLARICLALCFRTQVSHLVSSGEEQTI